MFDFNPIIATKESYAVKATARKPFQVDRNKSSIRWQVFLVTSEIQVLNHNESPSQMHVAFCPFTGIRGDGETLETACAEWTNAARHIHGASFGPFLLPRYLFSSKKIWAGCRTKENDGDVSMTTTTPDSTKATTTNAVDNVFIFNVNDIDGLDRDVAFCPESDEVLIGSMHEWRRRSSSSSFIPSVCLDIPLLCTPLMHATANETIQTDVDNNGNINIINNNGTSEIRHTMTPQYIN
jgi:hypothetical protein